MVQVPLGTVPGRRKAAKRIPEEDEILNKKRSKAIQKKYDEGKKNAKIGRRQEVQFQQSGRRERIA